jgi:hypothetical protein
MHQIRKTSITAKGGPGGVGVSYDRDDKQVHFHDGTTDRVVDQHVSGYTLALLTGITVTLPAVSSANKGLRVTFVNGLLPTSNSYLLSPNSADRIGFLADDADVENTEGSDVLGDLITIESDGVDGWIVLNKIGTWAAA